MESNWALYGKLIDYIRLLISQKYQLFFLTRMNVYSMCGIMPTELQPAALSGRIIKCRIHTHGISNNSIHTEICLNLKEGGLPYRMHW